jgi:predicted MFS family arabinose efflux permease
MTVIEQEQQMNLQNKQPSPLAALLGVRNFRLLWIGEAISLLGDQFHLIALPWLVLNLTGDAFAVGLVMALAGIPRALFMLVGGALTDRFSPRRVMMFSNLARLTLVLVLGLLTLSGMVTLGMLYIFALAFGLADAFFFPAQGSIVPRMVKKEHLQLANSITQGTAQISMFLGPVLAGTLIATIGNGRSSDNNLQGIGLAFIVDALTFLVSVLALSAMRIESENVNEVETESVLDSILDGLRYVWNDTVLRTIFLLIAAANFLILGPIQIGIPLLAETRLEGGAAAYGIILSAFGAGSLLGIVLAGSLPRPPERVLGIVLLTVWSVMGLVMAPLGLLSNTAIIAGLMMVAGAANSYVVIIFISWLQARTPEMVLGRVMSLLMFASIGLLPVSMALSGRLLDLNIVWVFGIAGLLMTALVLLSMLNPSVRSMEAQTGQITIKRRTIVT